MKTTLLLLIVTCNFCFSQQIYTSKNGSILENGKKINSEYLQSAFGQNQNIINLYNEGKTKQIIGNVLFYGGLSTIIIKHISVINKANNSRGTVSINNTMYFVGLGMVAASIPVKIGYTKKIKTATALMNEEISKQKKEESLNLIINQNGIGIGINF